MALALQKLRLELEAEEPDYGRLAIMLKKDDLPSLVKLVKEGEVMLASKAAYAITLIKDPAAAEAARETAGNDNEIVRIAVAGGLKNLLSAGASMVVGGLLADASASVRKAALGAVKELKLKNFDAQIGRIASNDPEPGLRKIAKELVRA